LNATGTNERRSDPNPDHEAMLRVAAGDVDAMDSIYRNRHRALFRFFFRMSGRQATSEDLVHEVFLRMLRYRHTYGSSDGFEAWMYRVARNVFADHLTKHRLEVAPAEGEMEAIESHRPSPYESAAKSQDLAVLHRALRELPEDRRELIIMSRFQGLSHEQMGHILGCETGTVKVRVFRAVKDMAKIYNDLVKEKAS
jgi:RNA polymerase sigma-70 factor (ECF subfamily)